jgi:hypothetical protein
MAAARREYKNEEDFIAAISKITLFDVEELKSACKEGHDEAWSIFE